MKKRICVVSAILEKAADCQKEFNEVISKNQDIVKGRMGLPFLKDGVSVISLVLVATMDEINSFTGKLGKIENVQIKTTTSQKEY